jgi:hypothetical protein
VADAVADDALFGPDGTQDPPPPPVLSDPLAGLITGAAPVREGRRSQPQVAQPAEPPQIDSSMRDAIEAAMGQPRGRGRAPARRARPGPAPAGRPATRPAQPAQGARPANAAGCLIAALILLVVVLATAGRAILDVLSHAFH